VTARDGTIRTIGGIEITHADRAIFPQDGVTKGDLAAYYHAVAPLMLPFAAGRPVSLLRCPDGLAGSCFFQKHGDGFGTHVDSVPIVEKDGGTGDYLAIGDAEGLLACVQMGTVEFHGWGARSDAVEQPDRLVFDLDPDEGLDFAAVARAAREVRKRLSTLGLESFAMLTGGKGIHVIAPLTPGHDWAAHAAFAKHIAGEMAQAAPDRFVATMSKAKRKGRIFIDWLRNQRGNSAVLPYSVRARAGAPVAAPVAWDELDAMGTAYRFRLTDAACLIARGQAGALRGWGIARQSLPTG
jgi:bifunctional non-homologous end joining protein LigD